MLTAKVYGVELNTLLVLIAVWGLGQFRVQEDKPSGQRFGTRT